LRDGENEVDCAELKDFEFDKLRHAKTLEIETLACRPFSGACVAQDFELLFYHAIYFELEIFQVVNHCLTASYYFNFITAKLRLISLSVETPSLVVDYSEHVNSYLDIPLRGLLVSRSERYLALQNFNAHSVFMCVWNSGMLSCYQTLIRQTSQIDRRRASTSDVTGNELQTTSHDIQRVCPIIFVALICKFIYLFSERKGGYLLAFS